jgi:GT2 family glycosyltransferase
MNREPSFTVGVSTLDRPEGLARCLDAILNGDCLPSEIVVVDQGSDDTARAVIEQRQRRGVPVRWVRQTGRGLSASRNAIVRATDTSFVAITDDDCVPDRGWLSAIAAAFAAAPKPDAVTGRVLALGPETPGSFAISLRTSTDREDFTSDVLPWRVGTGGNFAARRERIEQAGGYDERLGAGSKGHAAEDLDLSLRLRLAGWGIGVVPAARVAHEDVFAKGE